MRWTRSEGDRRDGKKIEVFIFLFFFVNRFVDCFFFVQFLPSSLLNARLHFHVIHPHIIIQHKVSFSSLFISFFLFKKNKNKNMQFHM